MLSVSFQCQESPRSGNLQKEGIHVSVSGEVTWEGGHLGLASSSCSHFSQSNSWLTSVVYGPHEVLESSFGEQALDKVRVRERKTVQGDGEKASVSAGKGRRVAEGTWGVHPVWLPQL